ncbi:MAG: response regulator [Polyangiales bacterium]|nr:response regulator transcription factor [Sandaracinaceae bacterium]
MVPKQSGESPPVEVGRILIVDDEPLIAARVATMLEQLGHVPIVAHDWSSALVAYDDDVDLVLLDLVMPKVDGFKLARLVRSRSKVYTPIVFLTGRTDDQARQKALEAGGDDFLVKPITPLDLRVRVTAMLRIRRLTQALVRQTSADPLVR